MMVMMVMMVMVMMMMVVAGRVLSLWGVMEAQVSVGNNDNEHFGATSPTHPHPFFPTNINSGKRVFVFFYSNFGKWTKNLPNPQIMSKWRVVAVWRVSGLLIQSLNCPKTSHHHLLH